MKTFNLLLRALYSFICYVAGVASLIYFILFVNDMYLSKTVNSIVENVDVIQAISINLIALALFGLQHSLMARGKIKQWITRFIHPSMERSTYVLATALVIAAMGYLWIPFGTVIWNVESSSAAIIIRVVAAFGWLLLLAASAMLNHFELFGLRQTFDPLMGKKMPTQRFKTPGLYKLIRHPIQTGILLGMWAVPLATTSHLFFATGMTLYILIGLYFEEKDLIREFNHSYLDYMKRVKRLIPFVY